MDVVKRFQIWLVDPNPTRGSELKKTRPAVIVSPDEVNQFLKTVIIVPLTSTIKKYPTRINCTFDNKKGELVIDQIRSIDKERLIKHIGILDNETGKALCNKIQETFEF